MKDGRSPGQRPCHAGDHQGEERRGHRVAQTCMEERLHGRSLSFWWEFVPDDPMSSTTSLAIELIDEGAELAALLFGEPPSFDQMSQ